MYWGALARFSGVPFLGGSIGVGFVDGGGDGFAGVVVPFTADEGVAASVVEFASETGEHFAGSWLPVKKLAPLKRRDPTTPCSERVK